MTSRQNLAYSTLLHMLTFANHLLSTFWFTVSLCSKILCASWHSPASLNCHDPLAPREPVSEPALLFHGDAEEAQLSLWWDLTQNE